MRNALTGACLLLTLTLPGCANLEFDSKKPGLTYFEPTPYLSVSKGADCKVTVTVLVLPGAKKTLAFNSGYGTADLSASVSSGLLQSVGQKTDTKVPETVTALAGVATAFKARGPGEPKEPACESRVRLYPIVNGEPDFKKPLIVPEIQ
jgi:hypothetical protein